MLTEKAPFLRWMFLHHKSPWEQSVLHAIVVTDKSAAVTSAQNTYKNDHYSLFRSIFLNQGLIYKEDFGKRPIETY